MIQKLLKDKVIRDCLVTDEVASSTETGIPPATTILFSTLQPGDKIQSNEKTDGSENVPEDISQFYDKITGDDEEELEQIKNLEVLSFEIKQDSIEIVQKRCIELEYPLLAEYDFRLDTTNPNLNMDLKPSTILR